MTDATELDIDAIRARMEAATPGPWRWDSWRDDLHHLIGRGGSPETYEYDVEVIEPEHSGECGCRSACYLSNVVSEADREFIAHARTELPAALDEITRLRAALDEARAEVEHWRGMHDDAMAQLRLSIRETTEARAKCAGLSDLAAEKNARAKAAESALASVRALIPDECWVLRSTAAGPVCTDMVGGGFPNGAKFTDEACCLPCRIRAALAAPTTSDEGDDRG